MDEKFTLLLSLKQHYEEQQIATNKRKKRHKMGMFLLSIFFLAIYYLELQVTEVNLAGIKIENINFSKIIFIFPVLITMQFAHYSLGRLWDIIFKYKASSISQELERHTDIDVSELFKNNPYLSSHNTEYSISAKNPFFSLGKRTADAIIWAPIFYVYAFSSFIGCKNAKNSNDTKYAIFYFATLSLCSLAIIAMQLSRKLAFRKHR